MKSPMNMNPEEDEEPPVPLWRMTPEEQVRQQTGPGTEGLPGFVVVDPGPNAWYRDEQGVWRQVDDEPTPGKPES